MGLGISRGEGEVYWAVIIPIFHGTGAIFFVGTILIILAIFLLMIGFVSRWGNIEWGSLDDLKDDDYREPYTSSRDRTRYKRGRAPPRTPARRTSVKHGGVVFIGPIPIIWGSDKKIATIMAVVALILVIIFVLFIITWLI
jgi:uncharacterized protein (TIGR00304 family)